MVPYAPMQQVRRSSHPVIGKSRYPSPQGSKLMTEASELSQSAVAASGASPSQGQNSMSSLNFGKTVRNISSQQQQLCRSAFSIDSILEPKSPRKQKHQTQQQQRHPNQEVQQRHPQQHQQLLRFSGQLLQQPALPLPASVYGTYPRPSYIIPAIIPSSYYPLGRSL